MNNDEEPSPRVSFAGVHSPPGLAAAGGSSRAASANNLSSVQSGRGNLLPSPLSSFRSAAKAPDNAAFGDSGAVSVSSSSSAESMFCEDKVDNVDPDAAPGVNADLFTPWQKVRAKKTAKARAFLIETVLYGFFILVFCLTTFALRSPWTYWCSENVRRMLSYTEFAAIDTTEDFYSYLEGSLLPVVYPSEWYNGRERSNYESRFAAVHNRLLGTVRLRQIRVAKNTNCFVSAKFQAFVRDCYPEYSGSAESEDPYGPAGNRSLYQWSSADDLCRFSPVSGLCNSYSTGKRGDIYPSGGFVRDLPTDQAAAQRVVYELKQAGWIDHQTRAVVLDFTTYNANVKMLTVVQLLTEWFPTGTVVTRTSIKPIPPMTLDDGNDIASLALEIVLATYLCCYLVNEAAEFYSFKSVGKERCIVCRKAAILETGDDKVYSCVECSALFDPFENTRCTKCLREYTATKHLCWKGYFQDVWNWLDIVNLFFFVAVFSLRFSLRSDMAGIDYNVGHTFILMYPIANKYTTSNYLNSVNALLCFLKTFKYLGKFDKLAILIRTMSNSRKEIGYFLVIFGIIFVGFALAFQLGFGSDVEAYQSMADSLMSLFLMLLGDFDYQVLVRSNRVLAPLFFVFYNVLVVLVLSNMFIAIVSGAYATAYEEPPAENFVSSSLTLFFNSLSMRFERCRGRRTPLHDVLDLIERLSQVQALNPQQLEDVRVFHNEVEHNTGDVALFHALLSAFDRRIDREMTIEDYYRLKDAVLVHKNEVSELPSARPSVPFSDAERRCTSKKQSGLSDNADHHHNDHLALPTAGRARAYSAFGAIAEAKRASVAGDHHNNNIMVTTAAPAGQGRLSVAQANNAMFNTKLKGLEDAVGSVNNNINLLLQNMQFERANQPAQPHPLSTPHGSFIASAHARRASASPVPLSALARAHASAKILRKKKLPKSMSSLQHPET
ncbi:Polycystin-2 [Diplonema papillatum]|nr:Polycystin-2 [Diplonema papillatum]